MSLKSFHIVFITLATLLAFGFAGWSLRSAAAGGHAGYYATALAALACGVGLIAYGFWFWRKIRTQDEREADREKRKKNFRMVPMLIAGSLLSSRPALACSVCYGEAEGPMIDAAKLGVWLLFGLVLSMQLAFFLFFVYLRRRAKRYREQHPEIRWAD